MVEPIDPGQGCELNVFDISPGTLLTDDLGLVQTVDGLSQRIAPRGQA